MKTKKQKLYLNLKRKVNLYLLMKNLKTKKKNKKLDYIIVGIFFIKVNQKLIALNLSCLKIIKYTFYSISCY